MQSDLYEIFADADKLAEHSDYCRREQSMLEDLRSFLGRAASAAPAQLYSSTRKLFDSVDNLTDYFGKMGNALTSSSEVVADYAYSSASRMQNAEEELSRLLHL